MFGSIVVGTDGSDTAKEAVRQSVELAGALGARLLVVSAYQPASREAAEAAVRDAARTAQDAGLAVEAFPRQGDPADAILDVAEEQDAGLIVVGNKGLTGAERFLLGSVPNKVSHHAPCSVLIIRTS
jgi:nucleotide-binding universal stress UspA family protein